MSEQPIGEPPASGPEAPRPRIPGNPLVWLTGGALLVAVIALVIAIVAVSGGGGDAKPSGQSGTAGATGPVGPAPGAGGSAGAPPTGPAGPAPAPSAVPADCPKATTTVSDAKDLEDALSAAQPGNVIVLRDGVYEGKFVASKAADKDNPIYLCGGSGAVLDGGGVKAGYVLHLDGASYWRVLGLTLRNGQKGLMADHVQGALIQGLTVEQIGDEGIHLRNFSSDNVVRGNTVRNTGNRRDTFGEGIYVGTAESNWCTVSDCKPDNSDRNVVEGNTITDTTSESVDIKEGTTGGQVINNTFDGAKFSGSHADSWIDVKGNDWLIQGNQGHNSKLDGFQTHEVVKGWGSNNVFKGNTAEVNGPGYGFNFTPVNGNKADCDNKVTAADKGFGNIPCA
ncbi:right-handed parallel beta-helix repeat-containing protein [Dactylosporangium sp. CA-092794]|uniref:right-handed parallel beta-helix repeat-containing protein n=1 Tax=Dactylosporangium sp. CA-092794 TaxID=3239929 RepID=UPI003D8CACDD